MLNCAVFLPKSMGSVLQVLLIWGRSLPRFYNVSKIPVVVVVIVVVVAVVASSILVSGSSSI